MKKNMNNGFRRLQERLLEEGWYVGWNHICCQSCGWADVPDKFEDGTDVDLSKVLFNHSQDCEFEIDAPYDYDEDPEKWSEWHEQREEALDNGTIEEFLGDDFFPEGLIHEGGFLCYPPEMQSSSTFCFNGGKKGVKNLKEILPIIEECGCEWNWDKTGTVRIEISWELEK